jgi:hypothetical protein
MPALARVRVRVRVPLARTLRLDISRFIFKLDARKCARKAERGRFE